MKKMLCAAVICSALTGCAGMNSEFDCNKTTTDQCLTMTEANKLAAQGKSLDDLTADKTAKKAVGETLPALRNTAPVVNPFRPVSVAATGSTSPSTISPRPLYTPPTTTSALIAKPISAPVVTQPVRSTTDAGQVAAQRIPDATQRLWIAPWIDTDDNLHQPAVVEFVKNKSHWDQDFRVISQGDE